MKKLLTISFLLTCFITQSQTVLPAIEISANKRFFQTSDGKPFFWMGDTGWLLFSKCNTADAIKYLETRKQQGFNVVQVMMLHTLGAISIYGDSALFEKNIAQPNINSNNPEHDYWSQIDFVIQEAAKRRIYIALVPLWGSNIKDGKVTIKQAQFYASFIAQRYGKYSNIIWLNGGDIKGGDALELWNTIGSTIKKYDPKHLITFHPRGRNSSSEWFHNEPWLDFNMFQSGHQDYTQDTSSKEKNHFGEDNWRFVNADYKLLPVKPTMDGEPSYENIPHGLHDSLQARWTAADVRRYAYWSVFAGGAGFTYGENAIMQFHTMGKKGGSFGVNKSWSQTIHAAGAKQMHLKKLMLSKPYFDRQPAQEIIADNIKDKYNYILATKGKVYAMAYDYTGRNFNVDFAKLNFKPVKASWYDPKNGKSINIKTLRKSGMVLFNPPGKEQAGNDWVLILE